MTRADFFKRILGCLGLGAIAATVKPAVAEPPWHLTPEYAAWLKGKLRVTDWDIKDGRVSFTAQQQGLSFRWVGREDNDWRNPPNWDVDVRAWYNNPLYSYVPAFGLYPGQDPNRLDDVIIPAEKECMMPEDLPMLNSLTIESGGTLWQPMDAPYETSPSWLRRLIVEDGAWMGRRRIA